MIPAPRGAVVLVALAFGSCARDPFRVKVGRPGETPETSLHWVLAAARGDAPEVRRLTALPFTFRSSVKDGPCEGRIATEEAFATWVACFQQRAELQHLRAAARYFGVVDVRPHGSISIYPHPTRADDEESARIGNFPMEDFGPPEDRYRVENGLGALIQQHAGSGKWSGTSVQWLYHQLDFKTLVVETPSTRRIRAVFMLANTFSD